MIKRIDAAKLGVSSFDGDWEMTMSILSGWRSAGTEATRIAAARRVCSGVSWAVTPAGMGLALGYAWSGRLGAAAAAVGVAAVNGVTVYLAGKRSAAGQQPAP